MRAVLPLAVLALAACDPPLTELFPPRFHSFEHHDIRYDTRAQYDPFARGWFVRVTSIQRPLEVDDLVFAATLAETRLGPLICAGNALDIEQGDVWNPLTGGRIEYLSDPGTFQMVGRCTGAPPEPGRIVLVVEPDVTVLIDEE